MKLDKLESIILKFVDGILGTSKIYQRTYHRSSDFLYILCGDNSVVYYTIKFTILKDDYFNRLMSKYHDPIVKIPHDIALKIEVSNLFCNTTNNEKEYEIFKHIENVLKLEKI